jgi:DNA-binding IclR family transcriptional regulator
MKARRSSTTTPTVQVIERCSPLLEILAGREEAVSLKEISEKSATSTAHRILNQT